VTTIQLAYGAASVVINVDADGKLADCLVTKYTDPAFADEAVRVLREWKYQPALVDGKPVGSLLTLSFEFRAHLKVMTTYDPDPFHGRLYSFLGPRVTQVLHQAAELDEPVTTVQTVKPEVSAPPAGGNVLVSFYVDPEGRARMPVVVSSSQDLLAQAAVDALTQWRFKPPTVAGHPAAVRVEQEFVFTQRT